jgi:hypothetical protein
MRLLALPLVSVLASTSLATANGAATSSVSVRAEIREQGIDLSLAMPHGPYAWNSFVPVTARVTNVSDHVVLVGPTEEFGPCFVQGPVVEVQRQNGQTVFPPSVPHPQALPCPYPYPAVGKPLQPGASTIFRGYIVLRAAHIRAVVTLVQGKQAVPVSTPTVTVTLRSVPVPRVTLHTDGQVFATLARPLGARGPLLAAWWWSCTARPTLRLSRGGAEEITRPRRVRAIRGSHLTPHLDHSTCSKLLAWHAVLGWSGFPAARVDYVVPSAQLRR